MPLPLRFIFIFCFSLLFLGSTVHARVLPGKYGVDVVFNTAAQKKDAVRAVDSMIRATPLFNPTVVIYGIAHRHKMIDKTTDFYLLLSLALMLGFLRFTDPKYFDNLWRAFHNPGQGRAAREQLDLSVIPNTVMNLFFTLVVGAYLFYVVGVTTPVREGNISPALLVIMLISGIGAIYTAKFFVVKFSGWAFKIEDIAEYYVFNIFLINKITAIALFPFVLLLAFGSPDFSRPAIIISGVIIVLLLTIRYIRSWQVFGSFFQYSKFHFFTYLCASEILPLAVLIKLLVRGLLY